MIRSLSALLVALSFLAALTGCVQLLDATTSEPINHDPTKRSLGTYINDRKIRTTTAVNLRKAAPGLSQANINVHVFNGIVLLTGEVPSKELRLLAGKVANQSHLVRQVHNELNIQGNATFFSRTNDNWLFTKVKTRLLAENAGKASDVKLIVENRIVYIMGMLTQDQARILSEIVANTKGVEKVVRVIDYVPDEPIKQFADQHEN